MSSRSSSCCCSLPLDFPLNSGRDPRSGATDYHSIVPTVARPVWHAYYQLCCVYLHHDCRRQRRRKRPWIEHRVRYNRDDRNCRVLTCGQVSCVYHSYVVLALVPVRHFCMSLGRCWQDTVVNTEWNRSPIYNGYMKVRELALDEVCLAHHRSW
jgi:hypothetical protein